MKSRINHRLSSRRLLLLTVSVGAVLYGSTAFAAADASDLDAPIATAGGDIASQPVAAPAPQQVPEATPTPFQSTPTPTPGPAIPKTFPPVQRLNPTGHDVSLSGPLASGGVILGELGFTLGSDDSIRVDAQTFLALAKSILAPAKYADLLKAVGTRTQIRAEDIRPLGYDFTYSPETISLSFVVPSSARASQSIDLAERDQAQLGDFDLPAHFSAYMTLQGSVDYEWNGLNKGIVDPLLLMDGAARYGPVVLESEQNLEGGTQNVFQRQGTRLVYDDLKNTTRWTVGDLLPTARGFSGTSPMSGVSIYRSYQELDPQRNVQPLGNESFSLAQPSTVQAYINGVLIRQIRLNPGTYNIHDFPFAQGSNNVSLVITDDAGNRQTLNFSLFFDQTLLAPGLSEFGLYVGVLSPFENTGPQYHWNEPAVSGYYRRGITDSLTVGVNFQAQRTGGVGGLEGTLATRLGTFTVNGAASENKGIGAGYAVNFEYTQTANARSAYNTTFAFSGQYQSANFAAPDALNLNPTTPVAGTTPTLNNENSPYGFQLDGSVTQGLWNHTYASLDAQWSQGRDGNPNQTEIRLQYGWEVTRQINLIIGAQYEDDTTARGFGGTLSLVWHPNQRVTGQVDVDTLQRQEDAQVSVSSKRTGADSWNADGEIIHSDGIYGFDGDFDLQANHAEFGVAQESDFNGVNGSPPEELTTARFGTSLVFADGKFGVGRPVFDSFALVEPHASLKGANVMLDRNGADYLAQSDWLGPAVDPDLTAYSEHTETIDVPKAPPGYDLGAGSIRMYPPYHSGYRIIVGSDYSVTAVGRLLDHDGAPISLLAGNATEAGNPKKAPIVIFTNREGAFGATGLKPGKWIITMPTSSESVYDITIPAKANGVVRLGDLRPEN